MKFEIGFNNTNINNDQFLIDKLNAYYVPTNSTKYAPFEILEIDIADFNKLEDIVKIIEKEFNCFASVEISFDSPNIFINI